MKPTEDRIYVKRLGRYPPEDESDLIVIEDKPAVELGEVEAVGPGQWQFGEGRMVRVPMEVQVGDRVLFNRYAGTDVEVGIDAKHTLLTQSEVLAVIE